jgi:uncharacterized phage protein (TIGR01671 family)
MSREIRFRAWDIEDKFYRNVDTLRFPAGGIYFEDGCDKMGWSEVADEFKSKIKATVILEQFTGLYDKNKKPIYEGDIVRYGDTVHEVVFEHRNSTAYFGLVYSENETLPFGHYQDLRQIEIIGNVHEVKK